jgi:hypothetical protein
LYLANASKKYYTPPKPNLDRAITYGLLGLLKTVERTSSMEKQPGYRFVMAWLLIALRYGIVIALSLGGVTQVSELWR